MKLSEEDIENINKEAMKMVDDAVGRGTVEITLTIALKQLVTIAAFYPEEYKHATVAIHGKQEQGK